MLSPQKVTRDDAEAYQQSDLWLKTSQPKESSRPLRMEGGRPHQEQRGLEEGLCSALAGSQCAVIPNTPLTLPSCYGAHPLESNLD